jgi:hypothetical protein
METLHDLNGIFSMDGELLTISNNTIYVDGCEIPFDVVSNHISGSFWLSSIALILFLKKQKAFVKDKRVLELGAGLALPSKYIKDNVVMEEKTLLFNDTYYVNICIISHL